MNTTKLIGTILLLFSLGIGYMGVTKITNNTAVVSVLGIKIDASNESGKQQGSLYIGLAVVLFAGGIYTFNKAK